MTTKRTPEEIWKAVEQDALDDEAKPQSAKSPVALSYIRSLRPRARRPIVLWVAAAAAVLALGGEWLSVTLSSVPRPVSAPASVLRLQADDACRASRWRQCLARLEDAARLDPAGDAEPQVQAQRAKAREGIGADRK